MWNPQNQRSGGTNPWRGLALWPLLLLVMAVVILYSNSLNPEGRVVDWAYSEFLNRVQAGQVTEVTILDRQLEGKAQDPQQPAKALRFRVDRPAGDVEGDLLRILSQYRVKFSAKQPSQAASMVWMLLFLVGMVALFAIMMRRANPTERAMSFGRSRAKQYVEKDTKVTFDDVAGIEEPKQELQEVVDYLRSPEKFRRLGGRIPKGVLLVGAPGTGKTLLAKAVAGEARVPFFLLSGSDFVEMFVGVGASRVRDLFRQAQAQSPCIVFIDELDALGKARGQQILGGGNDEREQTLNQLLVEMDGFDSNTNVIIMGATNRPEILDPALMRPGRFDRQVMIVPPDIKGREAILKVHAQSIRMDPQVKLRQVAARTPGFVGADLANVVNEAALLAARRDRDRVTFEDFDEAIDRVSMGLERRSHVISPEEKKITAYHEGGHALVAMFVEHSDQVHKVTIIPRGFSGGATHFVPRDERRMMTREQLKDWMAMLLGGRAAEEVALGDISSGASNDIERVTDMARSMVLELGMSEALGPLNYEGSSRKTDAYGMVGSRAATLSEATADTIDREVRGLVDTAHERALAILREHRDALEVVAQRLLEVEVIDREEIYRLVGLPLPADRHEEQINIEPPEPAPAMPDVTGNGAGG